MAENYAKHNKGIYFATMHPGWSDTPGKCDFKLN